MSKLRVKKIEIITLVDIFNEVKMQLCIYDDNKADSGVLELFPVVIMNIGKHNFM